MQVKKRPVCFKTARWMDGWRNCGELEVYGGSNITLLRNQRFPLAAWDNLLHYSSCFLDTHTYTHCCLCHLLPFDLYTHKPSSVTSETGMPTYTPSWHTPLTVHQKSSSVLWLDIHWKYFFLVTEASAIFSCLYWFRSVTLHCAILHISNTLHESRHSRPPLHSAIKSRKKEREKWRMDTKQHAVALLIRFAIAKRLR